MNPFHFLSRTGLVVSLILSLGACSTTTQQGAVGIEREQMLLVSQNEMTEGARKAYSDVLKEAEKEGQLNTDPKRVAQLRAIAKRLVPHTDIYREDAPAWDWEVNYIDSDQLNAWCMPGGKIAFYSGIIDTLKLTEDEIAAIMGHEMAHALREHGRERASQAMLGQVGLAALQILGGVQGPALDASNMVVQTTFILPNSRTHETEADRMGVELAARAGFDPYGAVRVWEKMLKLSKDAPPEFLSTHPAHESRIKDLNKYAKRVMPLYEKAKAERSSN
ncbi:MAG: M48 family metallopeptidase [Hydrogenovibrio sp.]|uniref:M48 family metallopeptidase n=1 Tax=Hydrogenovibrio sp. TaxID=2065821 RepID=UPI002870AE57|nr:M48 family metallopeptidase [Hydrogenovibrio sp.]MDR9499670.1 M48 family metallopeptidase [Hydrogenovibrio sp.]